MLVISDWMLGSERSNSAPTDAKRPVGVISLVGDYGGTPSQKCSSILARNRLLASSEYRGADDKDNQGRHQNVGCIGVNVSDVHFASQVCQPLYGSHQGL